MSYVYLPNFFWKYALLIVQDIMNLITSKVVSTTPNELWTGCKPMIGLDLGSPTHVLKKNYSN